MSDGHSHLSLAVWKALTLGVIFFAADAAIADQKPVRGGTLTYAIDGAPNTLDCHAADNASILNAISPFYSTLLRYDPDDGSKIIGDLAKAWTVSEDGSIYTFKLYDNVVFHDGTSLTSQDIRASYDRLRDPPPGVTSTRANQFKSISSIETPDPGTVVFRLAKSNPAMLLAFANPYNCIYSSAKLAENPKYPEMTVLGTGPFSFVDSIAGSQITGRRFDRYFRNGLPYLDGVKSVFLASGSIMNSMAAGQVDAKFLLVTPPQQSFLQSSRGEGVYFITGPYNVSSQLTMNSRRAALSDVRVRRAINLALDRRVGEALLSRLNIIRGFGGLLPSGAETDMPIDELLKLPGLGSDIAGNRVEAKRLLVAAGAGSLRLKLLNRSLGPPWDSLGVFVVDQLRQIGVSVEQTLVEAGEYFASLSGGNFDLAIESNATISSDPTKVLVKFLPGSSNNYTGINDPILQDLFDRQAVALDLKERTKLVTEFQQRVLDQAYVAPLFRNQNTAALASYVKGWKMLANNSLNMDMAEVWIQK
jgi:peptide/nickel transport system substrate-binding protein